MLRSRLGKAVLVLLLLVVAAGAAGWWFFLRGDAPAKAALRTRPGNGQPAGAGTSQSADGSWKVRVDNPDQVFAGYRIQEIFGGETVKKTAAGRTSAVTGSFVVKGRQVTAGTVTVDVTKLESDRTARDEIIRNRGLESSKFPTATFQLSGPVTLSAAPARGRLVKATLAGTLKLHGVSRPLRVPVEARWNGDTIDVQGSAPVQLRDYGIEVLNLPIVKIDDRGTFEFQLTFVRS
ncbi:MAG: YceI family protein [Actinobacteria bacterium]|nr:YceI family protein [Actinomycetota bacterium]